MGRNKKKQEVDIKDKISNVKEALNGIIKDKIYNSKQDNTKQVDSIKVDNADTEPTKDTIGKIIQSRNGSYVLINKLGIGAYATVWMCYNVKKKELYAIKIFKPKEHKNAANEINTYERFNKMNINHIIKVHETFEYEGRMCMVLDLMAGSLYDFIKHGGTDEGLTFRMGFDIDLTIVTLHNILETLADLHTNGVIHGDIKPDNILLFGRTKMHNELLKALSVKTSNKRISECIVKMCEQYVLTGKKKHGSDDEDNNTNESNESDESDESNESNESNESDETESDKSEDSKETKSNMSSAPEKIVLSDSEDMYNDDADEDIFDSDVEIDVNLGDIDADIDPDIDPEIESELKHHKILESVLDDVKMERKRIVVDHLKLPKTCLVDPLIKLSDMGSCLDTNALKKPIGVQTKYYKSPEIILGLSYDTSCDIWAAGCTIYEILTGSILFNPDSYDGVIDKKRCMLHLICASLGSLPKDMIDISPYKQVFFTDGYTLKENSSYGDDLYVENKWIAFLESVTSKSKSDGTSQLLKKYLLLDLLLDMLKLDPTRRITAKDSLDHPLFKMFH